jgi:DNA-binding MarR family transcriptional regulator
MDAMNAEPFLPAHEDMGLLCMIVADGFSDAVLQRLREGGFGDTRFSHGFVVQGLLAGDRTVTDLAERLGVTVQAASKTVQEMERLGYVERRRDPADGRSWVLELSDRGRANLALARRARVEVQGRLVERVGEEGAASAISLLRSLAEEFGGLEALANRRLRPAAL